MRLCCPAHRTSPPSSSSSGSQAAVFASRKSCREKVTAMLQPFLHPQCQLAPGYGSSCCNPISACRGESGQEGSGTHPRAGQPGWVAVAPKCKQKTWHLLRSDTFLLHGQEHFCSRSHTGESQPPTETSLQIPQLLILSDVMGV